MFVRGRRREPAAMSAAPLINPTPVAPAPAPSRAAAIARDRIAALPGIRVLGVDGVRLAVDVRDTGRDGWQVACALAARGMPVQAAGGRAIVLRLGPDDLAEGMHERLAPALLQALWSVRPRAGYELALDPPERRRTCRIGISDVPRGS
jgi:hypothetical protein